MALERIDRMTEPPVVGRYYLVPTVWSVWCDIGRYWPVMGHRHEDAEYLKFPYVHCHVDCRFVSQTTVNRVRHYDGRTPEIVFAAQVIQLSAYPRRQSDLFEWKRLRCCRASHNYPWQRAITNAPFRNLYSAFAGVKCRRNAAGFVCPHKQFPLGSIAPIDGVITCPLHGLLIDAATGVCLDAPVIDSSASQSGLSAVESKQTQDAGA